LQASRAAPSTSAGLQEQFESACHSIGVRAVGLVCGHPQKHAIGRDRPIKK
jgi:hypothetical protein